MADVVLDQGQFLKGIPGALRPHLPSPWREIKTRRPYRWLVQLYFDEPEFHYEVSSAKYQDGWELGLHCESRDAGLNRWILDGFCRHLFEIKETLGEQVEAEMWDRGWTKIYEVFPAQRLSVAYQKEVGRRLAEMIICLQPIFVELRVAAPSRTS
jgi:hypothetical protein